MGSGMKRKSRGNGTSPQETLLDAAERLFAEKGFDGVSIRELTQAAGTNLASVNYYFGSKENLFAEAIGRRIRSVNARRLELLQAETSRAGHTGPRLEKILDAFVRPLFELGVDAKEREQIRRMVTRVFMQADSVSMPIFEAELLPVGQQFGMAIAQARPGLTRQQIAVGIFFLAGALINLFVSMRRFDRLAAMFGEMPGNEEVLKLLVTSGVATFDALGESRAEKN